MIYYILRGIKMLKIAVISAECQNGREEESMARRLTLALKNLAKNRELLVITTLGRGLETLAAAITLSLKGTKLECVIPFEEQAADWSEDDRDIYFDILEHSFTNMLIETRKTKHNNTLCYNYILGKANLVFIGEEPSEEVMSIIKNSGKKIIKL